MASQPITTDATVRTGGTHTPVQWIATLLRSPWWLTSISVAVLFAVRELVTDRFADASWFTGWTLTATVVLLALLGLRRRLPGMRLIAMRYWNAAHIHIGVFAMVVYVAHAPVIVADGWVESILSLSIVATFASGLIGWMVNRSYPPRLRRLDHEIRFGQFGDHRARLIESIESSVRDPQTPDILLDVHAAAIRAYFVRGFGIWTVRRVTRLAEERLTLVREQMRYLAPEQRDVAGTWMRLIRTRRDIDVAWVLQSRLRAWVLWHAVTTIVVIAAALIHIASVLLHAR